jgi:predicted HAD superfamily Cof-like phosphohydrolase
MSNYWADDQRRFMLLGEQTIGKLNYDQAHRYLCHIVEESHETQAAFINRDYVNVIDGAVDTIVVAIGLLHSLGVDPYRAWDAVHAANMRKIVDGKVYRRDDGQIGKPPGFVGPEEELKKLFDAVSS